MKFDQIHSFSKTVILLDEKICEIFFPAKINPTI